MNLKFLGGTGTVTGSKFLVETSDRRILVDCGLFQGLKELRLRNWDRFPIAPAAIDCVVLTHAHIDHSGYLPVLMKNGFSGPVYTTGATRDLCGILLPDSGFLQEEEAGYANREGFSKHHPALPLYTQQDAERSLKLFRTVPFDEPRKIAGDAQLRFIRAGHMLGAAIVELNIGGTRMVFSGDLGRPHDPVLLPPDSVEEADYLVLESTYGDRRHEDVDPLDSLADVVKRTIRRGGMLLIPAFAVGRAQALLHFLYQLKQAGRIPDVPVFLNSPMAIDASEIFVEHRGEHRLSREDCRGLRQVARFVRTVAESKALNLRREPMIIISASGMATGGRVLHHLKAFAPDPKNTILFAGYQAAGTRGASILGGAETVKIHGAQVPVNAEVVSLPNISGHADYREILDWLGGFRRPPGQTFITHGEPPAAQALQQHIERELGWSCHIPEYLESIAIQKAHVI